MVNKYNYEIGKMYDTIFFITMLLFEDTIINQIFSKYGDESQLEYDLKFYNEIKKKYPNISSTIVPFCYTDYETCKTSFLINYFSNNINFENCDYNNFIKIFSDRDKIKIELIKWYFPDLTDYEFNVMYESKDSLLMSNIIICSDISIKYKMDFLSVILSYDSVINDLIYIITELFSLIHNLHLYNYEQIDKIISIIKDKDKNKDISEKLGHYLLLTNNKTRIYMFSLVNPYGFHLDEKESYYAFGLGEKFLTVLDVEFEYNHITTHSFAKMVSSVSRNDIYKMFLEYEDLSVTDISNCLNLSKSTVHAHLDSMTCEKFICISKSINNKLYFSLNEQYLIKLCYIINKEKSDYIKLKKDKRLKKYEFQVPRKKTD